MATLPAGASVTSTLAAGVGATQKVASAASSVTALRVVTPGGMMTSQPAALRVTPVSSGVRSAGMSGYVLSVCARYALISQHLEFHPTIRQRGTVHQHIQASLEIILF